MQAGRLRHLIRIESPVQVKSLTGALTTTWYLFTQVWAGIEVMRGYEKQSADAAWPGCDTRITIRYIVGLLPTMRIVYNNKIYSILNINDQEERHREVILICQTGEKSA